MMAALELIPAWSITSLEAMAPEPPPNGSLFHYLTSDTQALGVLSWVSFLVTFCGFAITIWQISKTQSATKAATKATTGLSRTVKSRERLLEIANALSHLNSATNALVQSKHDAADIYVELATTSIFQVNELLGEFPGPQASVRKIVVRIKALGEALSAPTADAGNGPDHMKLALEARQIAVEMKSVAAEVRYAYDKEV